MEVKRAVTRMTGRIFAGAFVAAVALMVVVSPGIVSADDDNDDRIRVNLLPRAGASQARGDAWLKFDDGVLSGTVVVRGLPPQRFGSGRFYGVWFVQTEAGDKAFLGALISRQRSIIFDRGGRGETAVRATHFTDGPGKEDPIALGPRGKNLIIVLIENNIDGLKPAPVGEAVAGTF